MAWYLGDESEVQVGVSLRPPRVAVPAMARAGSPTPARRGGHWWREPRPAWTAAVVVVALVIAAALVVTSSVPRHRREAIPRYVQGVGFAAGGQHDVFRPVLRQPVQSGDVLVAWVAEFNAPGHVWVSDPIDGNWQRSVSEQFLSGTGDVALYFVRVRHDLPHGLTLTVRSDAATYLQGDIAVYRGLRSYKVFAAATVRRGIGQVVSAGSVAGLSRGQLVYAGVLTGGAPYGVARGGRGALFVARAINRTGSAFEEDRIAGKSSATAPLAMLGTATDWYAVEATFWPAGAQSSSAQPRAPVFDQGGNLSLGHPASTASLTLGESVRRGDLLVGWFAQYGAAGEVTVSDNVNGPWTRASGALSFGGGGDIALYYVADSRPSLSGVQVTVRAAGPSYLQATVGDYSGVATVEPLLWAGAAEGNGLAARDVAPATPPPSSLLYEALLTGHPPGSVRGGPGFKLRTVSASGDAWAADETIRGKRVGSRPASLMASFGLSTDWYAVQAAFAPLPARGTPPPAAPADVSAAGDPSGGAVVSWSAQPGLVYRIWRDGRPVALLPRGQHRYIDRSGSLADTYGYQVQALDGAGRASPLSAEATTRMTPEPPRAVQWEALSPGSRLQQLTIQLRRPVAAGDLLVGWFGQYDAPGAVMVSDNVNGAWQQDGAQPFVNGRGDIAFDYVIASKAAPQGLTITISASAPAYLQEVVADFRGARLSGPAVQPLLGSGDTAEVLLGPSGPVPAGAVVIGATITGQEPGSVRPGLSQGAPLSLVASNPSGSASLVTLASAPSGVQYLQEQLGRAATWYSVVAEFVPRR